MHSRHKLYHSATCLASHAKISVHSTMCPEVLLLHHSAAVFSVLRHLYHDQTKSHVWQQWTRVPSSHTLWALVSIFVYDDKHPIKCAFCLLLFQLAFPRWWLWSVLKFYFIFNLERCKNNKIASDYPNLKIHSDFFSPEDWTLSLAYTRQVACSTAELPLSPWWCWKAQNRTNSFIKQYSRLHYYFPPLIFKRHFVSSVLSQSPSPILTCGISSSTIKPYTNGQDEFCLPLILEKLPLGSPKPHSYQNGLHWRPCPCSIVSGVIS